MICPGTAGSGRAQTSQSRRANPTLFNTENRCIIPIAGFCWTRLNELKNFNLFKLDPVLSNTTQQNPYTHPSLLDCVTSA